MYFIVEGLQEYAAASGDWCCREVAAALFKKLFGYFNLETAVEALPGEPAP